MKRRIVVVGTLVLFLLTSSIVSQSSGQPPRRSRSDRTPPPSRSESDSEKDKESSAESPSDVEGDFPQPPGDFGRQNPNAPSIPGDGEQTGRSENGEQTDRPDKTGDPRQPGAENDRSSEGRGDRRFPGGDWGNQNWGAQPGWGDKRQQTPSFAQAVEQAGPADPILLNQSDFITQDSVRLVAEYRKGNADKETIPVILVHGENGKKEDWEPLAKFLAEKGMAVLTPDLRGHGGSTTRVVSDFSRGNVATPRRSNNYTVNIFDASDYRAMIEYDGRLWFQFLILRHNQEALNLRKLVIIGAEFGGTVGAGWAKNDWASKKGQFTKALVILSPFAGDNLEFLEAIKKRRSADPLKLLLFVGSLQDEYLKSAQLIQTKIGGKEKPETPPNEKKVPLVAIKTAKQGVGLVKIESFKIPETIYDFIQLRMNSLKNNSSEWSEIKVPESN